MLVFKTHCYQFRQSLNIQHRNRTQCSDSKEESCRETQYFVSDGIRTEYVRSLSQFAEGKVNSEIVDYVTSVIDRSDVMFEHFKLNDHVHNSVHVCLYGKWLKGGYD